MVNYGPDIANKQELTSKFDYNFAKEIADTLVETLEPFCERIFIAGSIRRQKSLVKDIEIVCEPKRVFIQTELFGNGKYAVIPEFHKAIREVSEKVVKGKVDGRYMQIRLKSGITLDMFMPQRDDFYRQFAIRTGSGAFSQTVIARAWVKKGWCGTANGLRKRNDYMEDGNPWEGSRVGHELPPVWQSEEDFFDWLGLKWVDPKDRNV